MHSHRLRHEPQPGAVTAAAAVSRMSGGFTLLEILIVLFIISLVVGLGVISFDTVMQEQELRRPVLEFKSLTAEAVRRATLYERPQVLIFDQQGMVMPLQAPRGNGNGDGRNAPVRVKRLTLPPAMSLSLRRFGAEKFAPAAGQRLIISPSGLCEPLTARFQRGTALFEVTLDPLTGGAKEERMVIE